LITADSENNPDFCSEPEFGETTGGSFHNINIIASFQGISSYYLLQLCKLYDKKVTVTIWELSYIFVNFDIAVE
jgi:hypothetical protein